MSFKNIKEEVAKVEQHNQNLKDEIMKEMYSIAKNLNYISPSITTTTVNTADEFFITVDLRYHGTLVYNIDLELIGCMPDEEIAGDEMSVYKFYGLAHLFNKRVQESAGRTVVELEDIK